MIAIRPAPGMRTQDAQVRVDGGLVEYTVFRG
jgi:hypothetical protein